MFDRRSPDSAPKNPNFFVRLCEFCNETHDERLVCHARSGYESRRAIEAIAIPSASFVNARSAPEVCALCTTRLAFQAYEGVRVCFSCQTGLSGMEGYDRVSTLRPILDRLVAAKACCAHGDDDHDDLAGCIALGSGPGYAAGFCVCERRSETPAAEARS